MIFLEADMSQVEGRIELMLAAGVPEVAGSAAAKEAIRLATAHPSEFDMHRWAASVVLDKSEADISDKETPGQPSERQTGKTSMYAFQRGVGAQTLSDSLLKSGWVVTPETCERRLAKLAARLPIIGYGMDAAVGFFPDVRRQLMRYRGLGNTWGRIWRCDYQRFEEHLYAEGYSFQPVSEAVDLINQCGFLPLYNAIQLRQRNAVAGRAAPRINVHGHDALLVSCHPDDAWAVAKFLDRILGSATRVYAAGTLQVPVTYKLGHTWKGDYEYKKLPAEVEFRDAAWACEEKGR